MHTKSRASLAIFGLWMISALLLTLLSASFSAPLFAHHGNAAYDASKSLVVKGTITDWIWANPHCWLKFDAKDDKGVVAHWTAEVSNPSDMVDRGWSRFSSARAASNSTSDFGQLSIAAFRSVVAARRSPRSKRHSPT